MGSETTSSRFDVSCRTTRYVAFLSGSFFCPIKEVVNTGSFRCKLPNVDPSTGVRHRVEPDRSLRKYRAIDKGASGLGCMGMQLCPLFETPSGLEKRQSVLEVGMTLNILEKGSHFHLG
jgi:hypothetical protein